MGKDLCGKALGLERVQKVLPKLQELRQWLADAQYKEEHKSDLTIFFYSKIGT